MSRKIVIVGGVAAGASAATRARRLNESAEIVIFEKSGYVSFANCGLPYHVGNVIKEREALLLQSPQQFKDRFNIDVYVRHEVTRIDRPRKRIEVKDLVRDTTRFEPYDYLILTTGASPFVPPIAGIESGNVFVLRTVEDMDAIRRYLASHNVQRVAVVGAGFIGLESVEVLRGLGLDIELIELADQVLPPLDADMAVEVADHVRAAGVNLHLGSGLEGLEYQDGQVSAVMLPEGKRLAVDMVLMGVGVRPNSKLAADAGLELGPRGHIKVNIQLQTSDPDILAAGDVVEVQHTVTGKPVAIPLAGPANRQGRQAGEAVALGDSAPAASVAGTAIVKVFDKVAATTGLSVRAAKQAGFEADHVLISRPHHAGYYPGAENMNIKLVYERGSRKILGAQIVGNDGVEARIDVIATVLHFGGRLDDLANLDLAYAPQFGAAKDPLHIAAFCAQNQDRGLVRQISVRQLDELQADGAQIVDVRTKAEFEQGSIQGARNIELDHIRRRYGELDHRRPVLVYCKSGQRSYNAARILMQHNFAAVHSLSGGFDAYRRLEGQRVLNPTGTA